MPDHVYVTLEMINFLEVKFTTSFNHIALMLSVGLTFFTLSCDVLQRIVTHQVQLYFH